MTPTNDAMAKVGYRWIMKKKHNGNTTLVTLITRPIALCQNNFYICSVFVDFDTY